MRVPFLQENNAPCKHIWAALTAAEAAGHFTQVEEPVELVLDGDSMSRDEVSAWLARRTPRSPVAGAMWPPLPPRTSE